MEVTDARIPKLAQLADIAAELRVECIHGPEQSLPFRLIDFPVRGPGGNMNGGFCRMTIGPQVCKRRPGMQSSYYQSLHFEGLGPSFTRKAGSIGLRDVDSDSKTKIMMCLAEQSPECEISLDDTVLKAGQTYRLLHNCMLSLASKDTPDLYLILSVSWRFLPLDDSWRYVLRGDNAESNHRKRICPG